MLQVPMIRARILERNDWHALAEEQKRSFFGPKAAALSGTRMQSMLRNLEAMLDMQPDLAADKVTSYIRGVNHLCCQGKHDCSPKQVGWSCNVSLDGLSGLRRMQQAKGMWRMKLRSRSLALPERGSMICGQTSCSGLTAPRLQKLLK